jgi:hypothetical protein
LITSVIPQIGHLPGLSELICGRIGQTYKVLPALGTVVGVTIGAAGAGDFMESSI